MSTPAITEELEQQRSLLGTRAAFHANTIADLKTRMAELETLAKNQQDLIDALTSPETPAETEVIDVTDALDPTPEPAAA